MTTRVSHKHAILRILMKKLYLFIFFFSIFIFKGELQAAGSNKESVFDSFSQYEILLRESIVDDNIELVRKLLTTKSDKITINSIIAPAGVLPLMIAGSSRMVDFLIKMGSNIEEKDNDGWTALHWAARLGNFDVVRRLLKHKANYDATNNKKQTPIELVIQDEERTTFDCYKICELLLTQHVLEEDVFSEDILKYHTHLFWRCSKTGDTFLHRFIQLQIQSNNSDQDQQDKLNSLLLKIKKIKNNKYINDKQLFWLFSRFNAVEGSVFHLLVYRERFDLASILLTFFLKNIECSFEDKMLFFKKKSLKIGSTLHGKKTIKDCLALYENKEYKDQQKIDYETLLKFFVLIKNKKNH